MLSRIFAIALVAAALWHCGGERVTQSQITDTGEPVTRPLSKLAAAGHAFVVLATVQQDDAPVSGVVVELSRSVAGRVAEYEWSATTNDEGQARIEITSDSGYYQARALQDGSEIGHWSSIPLNAGYEVRLDLPIGERARITSSEPLETTPADEAAAARTRAFLEAAIARYQRDGREATLAYYDSQESIEGDLVLLVMAQGDHTILALATWSGGVGSNWATHPRTSFGQHIARATEDGYWFKEDRYNILTGRLELGWYLAILHDGLVFTTAHVVLPDELATIAQEYVQEAISYYNREGRDATVAYYNSLPSIDKQFYLFLIDENDLYIAHPIFPHLKGTDIKDVVGSNGYELGKEIAKATEEGHWIDYPWPHPLTLQEAPKAAYAIRYDGLIFVSGYYKNPEDMEAHTIAYVERAIEYYKREGRDATATYYNSRESIDGQWFLTLVDENDLMLTYPILPHLIGSDVKAGRSPTGYEFGKEIAKATEKGQWVKFPYPLRYTAEDDFLNIWFIRYDGLIFSSGYLSSE
ncbi:MAG: cache domain-containing protein [Gemmatimonadota bacterium]|nr:cache domain-containing protein [Gemmatimonadota bacterium]